MDTTRILKILENNGFFNVRANGDFIFMEDPSCVLRSFQTFLDYAWVVILAITGILLFGWGLSKIRGAKDDILNNLKNLLLVFGIIAVLKPTMNLIYGDDLFAQGCKTVSVSIAEINELLASKDNDFGQKSTFLYEDLQIFDSGIPEYEQPLLAE